MSKLSGRYAASRLLAEELPGSDPLIDGVLWRQDTALLVGKEKSGKSILALQIACALSCGEPLFGEYQVAAPMPVAYIQVEGKIADTQSNLRQMAKALPLTPTNLEVFYYPGVPFDREEGYAFMVDRLDSWQKPAVIIIDPLYMFMAGDLKDDVPARVFATNLRRLMDYYGSTHLIVHHAHRIRRDPKTGAILEEGDNALFGSFVWKAFPDQVYLFERLGMKRHRLSCQTQRMGRALTELSLELVEPSPLYFRPQAEGLPSAERKALLVATCSTMKAPTTVKALIAATGISERTTWRYLTELVAEGKLGRQVTPGLETTFTLHR